MTKLREVLRREYNAPLWMVLAGVLLIFLVGFFTSGTRVVVYDADIEDVRHYLESGERTFPELEEVLYIISAEIDEAYEQGR